VRTPAVIVPSEVLKEATIDAEGWFRDAGEAAMQQ
jgi:hypothetical protein